ncbi:MAG: non-canonical purine NTP pyrophosphatase [Vampirovibrionales bacterium]
MDAPKNKLTILLASGNLHKVEEIQAFFQASGLDVAVLPATNLDGLDENASTFLGNAEIKARFVLDEAKERLATFTLGDDSGFIVEALAGHQGLTDFPGVRSNRWLAGDVTHADRCRGICDLLGDSSQRSARFVCAMSLIEVATGEVFSVEGVCPLWIRQDGELVGANGFGYDPMVHYVDEQGQVSPKTMAELSMTEKTAISHRGRALNQLKVLLASTF